MAGVTVLQTALTVAIVVLGATASGSADPPGDCLELATAGGRGALQSCRDALAASPDDVEIMRALAQLEFDVGDAARSVELWTVLLQPEWHPDIARGRAMALWRSGQLDETESALREIVDRAPSTAARVDLIRFLLATDRPRQAAQLAAEQVETDDACQLDELWGEALSALDENEAAAARFASAVGKGCPPFRWTRLGRVPGLLDRPEYLALLDPEALVTGLDSLDDEQCLVRFELLRMVMTSEVAPEVTDQILNRSSANLRLAGLALLSMTGAQSLTSWERLLSSDDFVLRKHTLRRIRQLREPSFVPVLEKHLEREALPGNANLTALALGELYLDGDDPAKGVTLLEGIPPDDPAYPTARMTLLDRAEAAGDLAAAADFLRQIRAVAPDFWIDPEREARLTTGVAPSPPTNSPDQSTALKSDAE
jgi:tetratricopeptide (TPR) repeat protein